MVKKDPLPACIFHIHDPGAVGFIAISVDAYTTFFRSLDPSHASRMIFQKPKEIPFASRMTFQEPKERTPKFGVKYLEKELSRVLSRKKKTTCHTLLLELLDKEADVFAYDDLCLCIYHVLIDSEMALPWCIGIAVSNHKNFRESVILNERLIPFCKEKNIGLILLSDHQNEKPIILSQGELPKMHELPVLQPSECILPQVEVEQRLSAEQITSEFQILFGHFQVKVDDSAFHVPAIASVRKISRNKIFIRQLQNDISRILDDSSFTICPFGVPAGGINELALALVEGNANRLCYSDNIHKHNRDPLLFLFDFLSPIYQVEDKIRLARANGTKQIAIAAIGRYQNVPEYGIPTHSYLNTNYKAVPVGEPSCRFCIQEVPVIEEDHFDNFAREIKEFDPFTFWDFIAQSQEFFEVGHWRSDRTPNHYHFRILTKPIFKRYCYYLSIRLRNLLETKSILPGWIQKIVCTEGEESTILATGLAEVLGLRQEDVVRIPRKFFSSIAAKQLDKDLLKYIDTTYGEVNLRLRNILIVDQAAHHFKTLSALRDICEYYNCTVLAFAVFIDRTDKAFSLGEYLHDSHYLALYSWPVPPYIAHECPCIKEKL